METSPQEIPYVVCPLGHRGVRGIQQCARCGLPIFSYEKEIAESLEKFNVVAREFSKPEQVFAIGIGAWGSKLLLTTLVTHGGRFGSSVTIGALTADLQNFVSTLGQKMPKTDTEKIVRKINHPFRSADRVSGSWKQVESLAEKDAVLSDRISKLGIIETEDQQFAIAAGALGEVLTAGILPYLSSLLSQKNPNISRIFFGTLPADDDPDQLQFNAYCGLSRLLKSGLEAAVVMQDQQLKNLKGFMRSGTMLGHEVLHPMILEFILGNDTETLEEFTRTSRSLRTQIFSAAFAYGRSYEIYENFGNIMEHSLHDISTLTPENVVMAVAIAKVPRRLVDKVGRDSLASQFNTWCRKTFPSLKVVIFRIVTKEEPSDRIDSLLLLGGARFEIVAKPSKKGYANFKSQLEDMDLWEDYGIAKKELDAIEEDVAKYDKRLSQLLKK